MNRMELKANETKKVHRGEEDIGKLARTLDDLSIWERVKVSRKTLYKIGYAMLGYIIAIILMALLY